MAKMSHRLYTGEAPLVSYLDAEFYERNEKPRAEIEVNGSALRPGLVRRSEHLL